MLVALALSLSACGAGDGAAPVGGGDGDATSTVDVPGVGAPSDTPAAGGIDTSGGSGAARDDVDVGPADGAHGDTGDGADAADAPPDVPSGPVEAEIVEFTLPIAGAEVGNLIDVHLAPVGMKEREVGWVRVRIGEAFLFQDTKLPTHFRLDTRTWPEGPVTLVAEAIDGLETDTEELQIHLSGPNFTFLEITPSVREAGNGTQIVLDVHVDHPGVQVTADFSALDTGWLTGAVTTSFDGAGHHELVYTVTEENKRPDGRYFVPITGSLFAKELVHTQLWLDLVNLTPTPFRVQGGIHVLGVLPPPSATWSGSSPTVSTSGSVVVTGGSITAGVGFNPKDVIGLIVGLEGHNGYYQIPLDGSSGQEEVILLMRAFLPDEAAPPSLPLRIALVDVMGRVSPYTPYTIDVVQVGSGDLQVSIAWDTLTDVDLHVVEPGGCELYYGNDLCDSGGELDLDSNPGCSIDEVNNENVFWPKGAAPVGDYIVRVDFYEDCCICGANYTVTINYCGTTDVIQGHFAHGDDDFGGEGSGVTVAEFSNADCQVAIRGTARYVDRTFDHNGFSADAWLPVRSAMVQLKRTADDTVIASGSTDRSGRYEIAFSEQLTDEVYVELSTRTDPGDGLRDITVMDHPKFKKVYVITSPAFTPDEHTDLYEQDVDVTVDAAAGAFNVFDVLVDGHDLVRRMTGKDLGELKAFWATGADTTDTLYCSQYFYDLGLCTELGAVSVQGKETDRDEYDDMVIQKEFFKLVLERASKDSNPGGDHDGTRGDPRLAWTEGVSTFFACDVVGTRSFVDSRPWGVYLVEDLETLSSPFAFGVEEVEGGAALLSDGLVAAVLWDLADTPKTEVFDGVHGLRLGIYDSVFGYFNKPQGAFEDRGAPGVELVDFLDGWFCRGWAHKLELQDLVVYHRGFPYDFSGPLACP